MTFEQAVNTAHVRSAIYREGTSQLFWKNHTIPLEVQVPKVEQNATDWLEFDPRDSDSCSLFMFND